MYLITLQRCSTPLLVISEPASISTSFDRVAVLARHNAQPVHEVAIEGKPQVVEEQRLELLAMTEAAAM